MLHNRLSDDETRGDKTLCDLNLLGLGCASGSEWTSTIREECLGLTNQLPEKEKSGSTLGIALLGVLTVLALLGAATTLTQAPESSKAPQENAKAVSAN